MLHPTTLVWEIVFLFIQSLVLGSIFGVLSGKLSTKLIENVNLDFKGLYPLFLVFTTV